jgi:hypothetical protein
MIVSRRTIKSEKVSLVVMYRLEVRFRTGLTGDVIDLLAKLG